MSRAQLELARHALGLDRPLWQQCLEYVGGVLHANIGQSLASQGSVWPQFAPLFPATLELSLCAIVFAVLFGMGFGILGGVWRGSAVDYGLMGISITGASMPIPWWGIMLDIALCWRRPIVIFLPRQKGKTPCP